MKNSEKLQSVKRLRKQIEAIEAKESTVDSRQSEELLETIAMLELIIQGEQDIIAGRHRPAADVFRELKNRYV